MRPFELLLHATALADAVAALGRAMLLRPRLADADRRLVTLATGRTPGCAFVH